MTLVVTHPFVSPKPQGGDSTRVYGPQWNANHTLTGTTDSTQLNANVVQAVVNDTNIQGSIASQTLTFAWGGTLAAARLNANVVQAITNDTNVTGTISAQNLTLGWTGQLGLARGGTNANLNATGGTSQVLKQTSVGGAVSVGQLAASDLSNGTTGSGSVVLATAPTLLGGVRLSQSSGHSIGGASPGLGWGLYNVGTITATGGNAIQWQSDAALTASANGDALQGVRITASSVKGAFTGVVSTGLYIAGGLGVPYDFGINVSDASPVNFGGTLTVAGALTYGGVTLTNAVTGTGKMVLATSPSLTTPVLGTPTSGTLTNCTGLPLSGLANQAAWTLVFNNTSGSAAPTANTIDGLTVKASPAAGDELILWDVAGTAIKKATVSSLASASGVSSIAGNTGAFTLAGGVTNSTNQIQHDGNYSGWGLMNCTLAASVASNILTVALKDNTGADPSATSPAYINYRNVTAATGSTSLVSQTAALSITTNATGATLGSSNSKAFRFWVVVFNNGGTNVLALINCSNSTTIFPLNEGAVASSTAISGSATSAGVFYTPNGTTVTSKAFRILGYVEYNSTGLATAGTYATGPNFIQTFGPGIYKPGEIVQLLYTSTTTAGTTSSATFVALSTGITLAITPSSAANPIKVESYGSLNNGSTAVNTTQLSRGTTAATNLFGAAGFYNGAAGGPSLSMFGIDLPNTTSSTTYAVQGKTTAGTLNFPLAGDAAVLSIEEIMG